MWLLLFLTLINMGMGFIGRHIIRFSGFDIAPAAVAIAVWNGSGPILSSLFLSVGYSVTSVYDMRYLWLTLPLTIMVAYLSYLIPNIYVLVILYHLIGGTVNWFIQHFDTKYFLFILMNVAMNFTVARVYGAVF